MSANPHQSTPTYQRRRPELTSLYRAVARHLPKLNDRLAHEGKTLPRFVHETFQRFLSCGQLKGGFARLYCHQCKHSRLVPFSCKRRGVCSSCAARQMTQRAQRQREEVIPSCRTRQWVLTFPNPLHTYLAYFPEALNDALDVFIDTLRYHYQRRCLPLAPHPPERYDIDDLNAYYSPRYPHDLGAITSVQRHTDALTLYPHFHVITTDGLLVTSDGPLKPKAPVAEAHFLTAPYLESEDLVDILILYEHRLTRRFIRRGYLRPITPGLPASEQSFTLHWGHEAPSEEESQLLKCYAASAKLRHAFGPRAGQPLELHMEDALAGSAWDTPLCVSHSGFNLHANTVVEASDRNRLEQLCRYIQRPVIAQDRLAELEDGRFYYEFKRVWKNGTKGIFFEGPDLLERLAALIPPPRRHQVRYHGVYAPNSRFQAVVKRMTFAGEEALRRQQRARRRVYWVLWAELLKRTFAVDVTCCPICSGSMQRISLIYSPEAILALLPYDVVGARGPP